MTFTKAGTSTTTFYEVWSFVLFPPEGKVKVLHISHLTSYSEAVEMRKGVKDLNGDAPRLHRRKWYDKNIISLDI